MNEANELDFEDRFNILKMLWERIDKNDPEEIKKYNRLTEELRKEVQYARK